MTEQLIGQLGYLGITLILILGGLGLPIPEEAPIILAAVLSRNGQMKVPLALASCLAGVLIGDLVVYFLGFFYGEKVLRLPVTRRLLTKQREAQIKGYFHRHGFKILVSGRFVPGFRTAAYLTAGILKLPTLKLIVTDLVAASLTTLLMFALGYGFADQIQKGIREVQQWVTVGIAVGVATWLFIRYEKARRRSGLPVGPPVLDSDDVPLPAEVERGSPSSAVAGPPSEMVPAVIVTGPEPAPSLAPLDHAPPDPSHSDPGPATELVPPTMVPAPEEPPSIAPAAQAPPEPLKSDPRPATRATRNHDPVTIDLDASQPSSIESTSR